MFSYVFFVFFCFFEARIADKSLKAKYIYKVRITTLIT